MSIRRVMADGALGCHNDVHAGGHEHAPVIEVVFVQLARPLIGPETSDLGEVFVGESIIEARGLADERSLV